MEGLGWRAQFVLSSVPRAADTAWVRNGLGYMCLLVVGGTEFSDGPDSLDIGAETLSSALDIGSSVGLSLLSSEIPSSLGTAMNLVGAGCHRLRLCLYNDLPVHASPEDRFPWLQGWDGCLAADGLQLVRQGGSWLELVKGLHVALGRVHTAGDGRWRTLRGLRASCLYCR